MNKRILVFIIVINFSLICGQYLVTSVRATDGQLVSDLQKQLQTLSVENKQLQHQIFVQMSMSNIHQQALKSNLQPVSISTLDPIPVAAATTH